MCKNLLLFIFPISVLSFHFACAQYTDFKPVSDIAAFKKTFSTESAKISSIASNFTQEKNLIALTEKITSSGIFRFKRSNKVRLEYQKPFAYLMIMNGDKMMLKDEAQSNTVNLKSNKLFQQINKIVVDCIQGTILDSSDFSTRVFESRDQYLLEMTTQSKNLKTFFQTIVLRIEKKDYSAKSITMSEPSGDSTIITFTEKQINAPLADQAFAL